MSNLKDRYFFLIDFILPEKKDLLLKTFFIVCDKKYINFLNYYVYPVKYDGFFNSQIFILLNREKVLFKDKSQLLQYIEVNLLKGLKNLYSFNYKPLKINFEEYVDEIGFEDDFILIEYEIKDQKNFSFYIIITKKFLLSFIKGLVNDKTLDVKNDSSEILSYIKLRLHRDSITSFLDLNNFVNNLDSKDIQLLVNQLLKNNIIEETMLSGFISGFHDNKLKAKFLNNLSRNLREDVQNSLYSISADKRWIEESYYLIKAGIERLIFNNKLKLTQIEYINEVKTKIKNQRFLKIFKERSFEDYLLDAYNKDLIEMIKLNIERKRLVISLIDCHEEVINLFLMNLSNNAKDEFLADLQFFKNQSASENILKAKIEVIEVLNNLIYEEKAKDISVFNPVIMRLSPINLKLLIEEAGVVNFIQATLKAEKEMKRYVLSAVKGIEKALIMDLYSGKVRFKKSFGEVTIKKIKVDILKTYFYLKDSGKFIY